MTDTNAQARSKSYRIAWTLISIGVLCLIIFLVLRGTDKGTKPKTGTGMATDSSGSKSRQDSIKPNRH